MIWKSYFETRAVRICDSSFYFLHLFHLFLRIFRQLCILSCHFIHFPAILHKLLSFLQPFLPFETSRDSFDYLLTISNFFPPFYIFVYNFSVFSRHFTSSFKIFQYFPAISNFFQQHSLAGLKHRASTSSGKFLCGQKHEWLQKWLAPENKIRGCRVSSLGGIKSE